jgi:flagellar hook protein FlgE
MSIWGAFTNSVQAIQAQSDALAQISQNVANVNTVGYKKSVDNFQTLLSESTAGTNIFGVQVAKQNEFDVQGNFLSTGIWDNLAINGPGFFVLNSAQDGSGNTFYTRAGNFESAVTATSAAGQPASAAGRVSYLTDGKGDFLMGWKAVNGAASTSNSLSDLTAVNYSLGSTIPGRATTQVAIQGSIPSDVANATSQAAMVQKLITKLTATNVTSTPGFDPNTTQTYNTGTLQIQRGTVDTTAGTFSSSGSAVTVNITDGSLKGVADAINAANAGVTASVIQDSFGNFQLQFTGNSTGSNQGFVITGADTGATGASLAGLDYSATNPTQNGADFSTVTQASDAQTSTTGSVQAGVPVYDNGFNAQTLGMTFTKSAADTWVVTYNVDPSVGTVASTAATTLSFDGAGNFLSQTGTSGVQVTWADGTSSTINIDFSKMSQLASGTLQLNARTQNGYGAATMVKAEFDSNGNLYGDYSNGQKVLLFTIPMATFTAPNALQAVTGTLFKQTAGAGSLNIDPANALNTTAVVPGALESSNVTLEDEFSRMITTQTAYNSATKVFDISDKMVQSVRDLIT